jgi:hypothetical protein
VDQLEGPKYVPMSKPEPATIASDAIGVWTLGEVAAKLQISKAEVEGMIAAGEADRPEGGMDHRGADQ